MENKFSNGYAFILEGETEKEFYMSLLEYLSRKYGALFERVVDTESPDISYLLIQNDNTSLLKFNVVNTVSQMPRAGKWFSSQCIGKYDKFHDWYVFLCYDKDSYKDDISKFYEGDWAVLRSCLKKAKCVIDMAAAADIEDIMLQDLGSICAYLDCKPSPQLRGKKGKVKMKNLFRENGKTYHEGKRSREIIDLLDKEVLLSGNVVSLKEIEKMLFQDELMF